MKMVTLWITLAAIITGTQAMLGNNLRPLINPNAMLLVFGSCFAYLVYFYGIAGISDFAKRAFTSKLNNKDNEVLERVSTSSLLFGGVGALLGMMQTLSNLSRPESLGVGVGMAFVSVFYGMLPMIIALTFKNDSGKNVLKFSNYTKKAAAYTTAASLLLVGNLFIVLYSLNSI